MPLPARSSREVMASASFRGGIRKALAFTMAALVAKSPLAVSAGTSTA